MCIDSICKDDFDWRDQSHWLTITRKHWPKRDKPTTKTERAVERADNERLMESWDSKLLWAPLVTKHFLLHCLECWHPPQEVGSLFPISFLLAHDCCGPCGVKSSEGRGRQTWTVCVETGSRFWEAQKVFGNHYTSHTRDGDTQRFIQGEIKRTGCEQDVISLFSIHRGIKVWLVSMVHLTRRCCYYTILRTDLLLNIHCCSVFFIIIQQLCILIKSENKIKFDQVDQKWK